MNNYYTKYLKYKNKYIELKNNINQTGGKKIKKLKKTKFTKIINILLGGGKIEKTLEEIFSTFNGDSDGDSLQDNANSLEEIFVEKKISPCHGINHAKAVMYNAWEALKDYPKLSKNDKLAVLLAALLHDADDGKFFPCHKNNENLKLVLHKKGKDFVDKIEYMVNLVSSSKNGNIIPDDIKDKEWMLIPRYADRLEAIGLIGIERCLTYNLTISRPLFLSTTPRPKTEKQIWAIATKERYERAIAEKNSGASMIDHYYDKLLYISKFPISNSFFDKECEIRRKPLIEFLIMFGKTGTITKEEITKFIEDRKAPTSHECEDT
jgi:uncharacterized protein